jgi:hypothetical protein
MGQWGVGSKTANGRQAYIGLPTQSRNRPFIDSTPMFLVWLHGVIRWYHRGGAGRLHRPKPTGEKDLINNSSGASAAPKTQALPTDWTSRPPTCWPTARRSPRPKRRASARTPRTIPPRRKSKASLRPLDRKVCRRRNGSRGAEPELLKAFPKNPDSGAPDEAGRFL